MKTSNRLREEAAFSAMPKVRRDLPQDVFLQNNKYLVGQNIKAPRGGACQELDTNMWFPVSNNGSYSKKDLEKQKQAVEICRGCSIREKCLMYSLEYEPHGIWGGFPETARALLGKFWKIDNKRNWAVRASFMKYRNIIDYIVHPEDISFVRKVAHDNNLAQPPFAQRFGLSATAKRRIRLGLADTTR